MLAFLSAWWNAPFLVALLVALGFMAFTLVGAAKDVATDHAHAAGGEGKAPLGILATAGLLAFALAGLVLNAVAWDVFAGAALAFPVVLIVAAATGALSARAMSRVLGRLLPASDADARQPGEHVGRVGVTISRVTRDIGQVRVDGDARGPTAFVVAAADRELSEGTEVLLAAYDPARRLYTVVPTGDLSP